MRIGGSCTLYITIFFCPKKLFLRGITIKQSNLVCSHKIWLFFFWLKYNTCVFLEKVIIRILFFWTGSFYLKYPRHRKLISINKRNTGKTNKEFNMRHDWNSLLSHDDSLLMRHYSKELFPHADVLVKYLNDYKEKLGIKVQYNTEIRNIERQEDQYTMDDGNGQKYTCS